jgi:hypothetical protein
MTGGIIGPSNEYVVLLARSCWGVNRTDSYKSDGMRIWTHGSALNVSLDLEIALYWLVVDGANEFVSCI